MDSRTPRWIIVDLYGLVLIQFTVSDLQLDLGIKFSEL